MEMQAATLKATVVKNPKTFCSRTSEECIFAEKLEIELFSEAANVGRHFVDL